MNKKAMELKTLVYIIATLFAVIVLTVIVMQMLKRMG